MYTDLKKSAFLQIKGYSGAFLIYLDVLHYITINFQSLRRIKVVEVMYPLRIPVALNNLVVGIFDI